MIPNIVYSINHKESFNNENINKGIVIIEQIARYGCIAISNCLIICEFKKYNKSVRKLN